MVIDCQFIFIYGKFVTSKTASFSRVDIRRELIFKIFYKLHFYTYNTCTFMIGYKDIMFGIVGMNRWKNMLYEQPSQHDMLALAFN